MVFDARRGGWTTFALAAGLSLAAGPARAVVLPPAPDLPPATPAATDAFGGWYLRGDVGAGFETAPGAGSGPAPAIVLPALPAPAVASFGDASVTPSAILDVGAGYVFNAWLRADATLEYRFGSRLRSAWTIAGPTGAVAAGRMSAAAPALVALVNGYADLGDWWGVTPFVGAGVGVAETTLSDVSTTGLTVAGRGAAVPVGGLFPGGSRTNFAWALMAGLDYDIAPNLKLELGYRYLHLGPAAAPGARGAFASSDVRLGLVWLVGAPGRE